MARICQQRWKSGDKAFQRCSMRIPHACPPGRATWIWHVSCGKLPITGKQCICRRKHVSVNTKPYISHEQVSLPSFHQESLSTGPQKRKCITKESLSSRQCFDKALNWSDDLIQTLNPVRVSERLWLEKCDKWNGLFELLIISHCGLCLIKKSNKNNGNWNSD